MESLSSCQTNPEDEILLKLINFGTDDTFLLNFETKTLFPSSLEKNF